MFETAEISSFFLILKIYRFFQKMEISLERTPCCFALGSSNILAVGNMDGCLELNTYDPDPERQDFTVGFEKSIFSGYNLGVSCLAF